MPIHDNNDKGEGAPTRAEQLAARAAERQPRIPGAFPAVKSDLQRIPTTMAVQVAAVWCVEEAGELAEAARLGKGAEAMDAVLDMMGILLEVMALPGLIDVVPGAYREYVDAQRRRGRSLNMPHQKALQALVQSWPAVLIEGIGKTESGALAVDLFATRSGRALPGSLTNMLAALANVSGAIKRDARSAEDSQLAELERMRTDDADKAAALQAVTAGPETGAVLATPSSPAR